MADVGAGSNSANARGFITGRFIGMCKVIRTIAGSGGMLDSWQKRKTGILFDANFLTISRSMWPLLQSYSGRNVKLRVLHDFGAWLRIVTCFPYALLCFRVAYFTLLMLGNVKLINFFKGRLRGAQVTRQKNSYYICVAQST